MSPGECYEIKEDIEYTFDKEYARDRDVKQDIKQKPVYPLDIVILKESTYIVEQLLSFDSLYLHNIFSERTKNLVLICNVWSIKQDSKTILLLIMHSNTTASECDIFMNVSLWKDILEQFCHKTHSQYGIVAIIRAVMIILSLGRTI